MLNTQTASADVRAREPQCEGDHLATSIFMQVLQHPQYLHYLHVQSINTLAIHSHMYINQSNRIWPLPVTEDFLNLLFVCNKM